MGQTSKALGLGSEFEFDGKKYTVSPWTYEIQGLFERHLENEAVKTVRRMNLSDAEKRDLFKEVQRDIVAGDYTFGSDLVAKAVLAIPNLKVLLFLQLRPNHPEATMELAHKMVEEKLEEVYSKMAEANADPTTATETLAATMSTSTIPNSPNSSAA